jgi:hypothetical protein
MTKKTRALVYAKDITVYKVIILVTDIQVIFLVTKTNMDIATGEKDSL